MKKNYVLLALVVILAIPATSVKAASKITTLTLKNGAVYVGEVRNGRPNGNGSMTRVDSSINYKESYSGQWLEGKKNGYGTLKSYYVSEEGYYSDDMYVGGWKNDKEDGKGVETTESGSIKDGVAVVTSHYYSVMNSKDGEIIESYSRHEEENNYNFVEYSNQKTGLYISISFEGNGKKIYKKTEFMNLFNDYKNFQQIIYHIDKSEDKSEKMLKDKRIELYFEQESGGYYKNNIAYKDGTYREVQKEVYIDWENKPNMWSYTYSLQTDLKELSNSKTVALSIKPFMEEYKEVLPLLKPYLEGFKNLGH